MRMKRWRDKTGEEERERWSGEKENITRDESMDRASVTRKVS